MSEIKDYMLEKEVDDYIDSYNDNNFNSSPIYSRKQESAEEIERKADAALAEKFSQNDTLKEFPIIYNNNKEYRPSNNPSISGCITYLVFQGVILFILYLIFSR